MNVLFNGLSLDKKDFEKLLKHISHDKDLYKVLRQGRLAIIGSFLTLILSLIAIVIEVISGVKALFIIGTSILFVLPLITIYNNYKEFSHDSRKFIKYINYIKLLMSEEAPRKPFDMWFPFLSNLSDAHSLIASQKMLGGNENIKYVFCGEPYYDLKFIDSIIVSVPDSIKKRFSSFKKRHSMETFRNILEKRDFLKEEPAISKFVFGIFFFSKFLYEILSDNNDGDRIERIYLDISNNIGEIKKQFIIEVIKLAGDPLKTVYAGEKYPTDVILKIEDILFMGDKRRSLKEIEIFIPFKRYIALPKNHVDGSKENKNVDGNLLIPKTKALNVTTEEINAFFMGGAEHNLPLLHIIAAHREQEKADRRYGITENMFDRSIVNMKFRVGASHFVYGVNGSLRKRILDDKNMEDQNSKQCEVFKLSITKNNKTYNMFSFYGYSAPMTRIAFLKFLFELPKPGSNFIPILDDFKIYSIYANKIGILGSKFLEDWDEIDCMNNFESQECQHLLEDVFPFAKLELKP